MTIVAYLGPQGTHTHRAALNFTSEENLVAFSSIASLTTALDNGEIEVAVLPLENSLEGTVSATFDYLTKTTKKIIGELILNIEHVLAGAKNSTLSDIRLIASHPQALAQCALFINKTTLPTLPTSSTVSAISEISKNKGTAVIIPALAAEIYGLDIIAHNVADLESNSTRFCILSDNVTIPSGNDKTSILFEILDNPGSLYEILRIFAKEEINLTKIESRPAKYRLGRYLFAIDFIGHIQEKSTINLITKLEKQCMWLKVLGSYPATTDMGKIL